LYRHNGESYRPGEYGSHPAHFGLHRGWMSRMLRAEN
jgi:hypothetical protein